MINSPQTQADTLINLIDKSTSQSDEEDMSGFNNKMRDILSLDNSEALFKTRKFGLTIIQYAIAKNIHQSSFEVLIEHGAPISDIFSFHLGSLYLEKILSNGSPSLKFSIFTHIVKTTLQSEIVTTFVLRHIALLQKYYTISEVSSFLDTYNQNGFNEDLLSNHKPIYPEINQNLLNLLILNNITNQQDIEELKLLLALGADINCRDPELNITPLHFSIINKQFDLFLLLVNDKSVDIEAPMDPFCYTPILNSLIKKPIIINGATPLMLASSIKSPSKLGAPYVRMLLQKGANIQEKAYNITHNAEISAMDIAAQTCPLNTLILQLLQPEDLFHQTNIKEFVRIYDNSSYRQLLDSNFINQESNIDSYKFVVAQSPILSCEFLTNYIHHFESLPIIQQSKNLVQTAHKKYMDQILHTVREFISGGGHINWQEFIAFIDYFYVQASNVANEPLNPCHYRIDNNSCPKFIRALPFNKAIKQRYDEFNLKFQHYMTTKSEYETITDKQILECAEKLGFTPFNNTGLNIERKKWKYLTANLNNSLGRRAILEFNTKISTLKNDELIGGKNNVLIQRQLISFYQSTETSYVSASFINEILLNPEMKSFLFTKQCPKENQNALLAKFQTFFFQCLRAESLSHKVESAPHIVSLPIVPAFELNSEILGRRIKNLSLTPRFKSDDSSSSLNEHRDRDQIYDDRNSLNEQFQDTFTETPPPKKR